MSVSKSVVTLGSLTLVFCTAVRNIICTWDKSLFGKQRLWLGCPSTFLLVFRSHKLSSLTQLLVGANSPYP